MSSDPSAFKVRQGAVRVVTEGQALGRTIQAPAGMQVGATDWDGHPAQSARGDQSAAAAGRVSALFGR